MTDPSASQSLIYMELLFVFLAFILACVLYFLLRLIVTKLFVSGEKPLAVYFSRLSLPIAFLIVILCLKIPALSDRLFSSGAIEPYLDAAIIFFAIFFVLRLFDALFQSWFVRIKKPFPGRILANNRKDLPKIFPDLFEPRSRFFLIEKR